MLTEWALDNNYVQQNNYIPTSSQKRLKDVFEDLQSNRYKYFQEIINTAISRVNQRMEIWIDEDSLLTLIPSIIGEVEEMEREYFIETAFHTGNLERQGIPVNSFNPYAEVINYLNSFL